jgi:peptidoglycan/xylan/chitin deacetylase (PgdA/CDA1 family)
MLVLAYHRVQSNPTDTLSVSAKAFRQQLLLLMALGWHPADLSSVELRGRYFGVTFDDGYRDNVRYAAPILRSLQIPATFFIATGYLGDSRLFSWRATRMVADDPDGLPLQSEDVRQLKSWGFGIGAHSVTHPHLPELAVAELESEVRDSKRVIEDLCDQPCCYFVYPFGHADERVIRVVQEAGYTDAFITPPRPGIPNRRFTRYRVGVYQHDSLLQFALKTSPLYGPVLRPLIWQLRGRGLRSAT